MYKSAIYQAARRTRPETHSLLSVRMHIHTRAHQRGYIIIFLLFALSKRADWKYARHTHTEEISTRPYMDDHDVKMHVYMQENTKADKTRRDCFNKSCRKLTAAAKVSNLKLCVTIFKTGF